VTFDFNEVVVDDVSRHYGRRRALSHVSLTCRAGEVVGLLGPNGAGKSTLLSILATLLAPSSGEVRYGGRTAREAGPALRARLGLLAHELHLYPELSARENLSFFAALHGLDDPASSVAAGLERAMLADRANEVVSGFSRGMRQRLALERALLHGPRLLLLDEPFTGLDDASATALIRRLNGLKAGGAIVVVATHDLDVAEALLDRAAVLREGRLVVVDEPREGLRARYRSVVAAGRPTNDVA
jgi:heme ABC exporter ATP-binding subunit CcmA